MGTSFESVSSKLLGRGAAERRQVAAQGVRPLSLRALTLALLVVALPLPLSAATPAGTIITNVASAL